MPDGQEKIQPMIAAGERELLNRLREEANYVKDCFTRYTFQAWGLSAVILGGILRFQKDAPGVALASLLVIAIVLGVVRIGLHKYETANRIFGFELYLYRRSRLQDTEKGWKESMKQIGWEEALYAWRIIQPKVYYHLYEKYRWVRPTRQREAYKTAKPWIEPAGRDSEDRPSYYAGSYLKKTFLVLHLFAFAAFVPLIIMILQLFYDEDANVKLLFWPAVVAVPLLFGYVVTRVRRVRVKRNILENQLLSINSCAIIWHVTVVAHFRALGSLGARPPDWSLNEYKGYTSNLYDQADSIRDNVEYIYEWINGSV